MFAFVSSCASECLCGDCVVVDVTCKQTSRSVKILLKEIGVRTVQCLRTYNYI